MKEDTLFGKAMWGAAWILLLVGLSHSDWLYGMFFIVLAVFLMWYSFNAVGTWEEEVTIRSKL